MQNITPEKMIDLIKNNEKYKDFLNNYSEEEEKAKEQNKIGMFSIISDKTKNNHFNILQNTDVLSVIDKSIIEENTSQIFLSEKIKDLNFISKDKVNKIYKNLINEMNISVKDEDVHTYFNENDKYKEKFITEVDLKSLGIDDFVRIETPCLDGIKTVANNVNYVDKKVLASASKEEMLEKNNPIYSSLKKLYDVVYGENYFENENEFKEKVKNDLKYDFLTINDDVKEHKAYFWLIDSENENYAIEALDSKKPIIEGTEAERLFGTEISNNYEEKKDEELDFDGLKDTIKKDLLDTFIGKVDREEVLHKIIRDRYKGDYRFDLFSTENQDKIIKSAIKEAKNEAEKITFELGTARFFANYFSVAVSNTKCENGKRVGIEDFINDFSEGQKLLSPILGDMSGITLGELNNALEKEGFKRIEFVGENGTPINEKTTLSTLDRINESERLRRESPEIYKKVKSNEEEM